MGKNDVIVIYINVIQYIYIFFLKHRRGVSPTLLTSSTTSTTKRIRHGGQVRILGSNQHEDI